MHINRYFNSLSIHLTSLSTFSHGVFPSNEATSTFASKDRMREVELSDVRNASSDRLDRLWRPCQSSSSGSAPVLTSGGQFSLSVLAAFLFTYASARRQEQSLHVLAYLERIFMNSAMFRGLVFRHVPHFCVGWPWSAGASGAKLRIWLGI